MVSGEKKNRHTHTQSDRAVQMLIIPGYILEEKKQGYRQQIPNHKLVITLVQILVPRSKHCVTLSSLPHLPYVLLPIKVLRCR
jgi:hypothetical protein